MRDGRTVNPKLKKIDSGEYLYDGRYSITCHGYDRIIGHIVWGVFDNVTGKQIARSESLNDGVRWLEHNLDDMRDTLREIESDAANALAHQTDDDDANRKRLVVALSGIEKVARNARGGVLP